MSLTSRIQALTAYANEVTGESDTTLADAVATLAQGYGQGGSGGSGLKDITFNGPVWTGNVTNNVLTVASIAGTGTGYTYKWLFMPLKSPISVAENDTITVNLASASHVYVDIGVMGNSQQVQIVGNITVKNGTGTLTCPQDMTIDGFWVEWRGSGTFNNSVITITCSVNGVTIF